MKYLKITSILFALFLSNVFAGSKSVFFKENVVNPIEITKSEPAYRETLDKIWKIPTIYNNKENPFLQNFSLWHRYQYQYVNISSDQGDHDFWDTRRWRIGGKIQFLQHFTLKTLMDLDNEGAVGTQEEFVFRISHLVLDINLPGSHKLTVGNFILADQFSNEVNTSEIFLPTIERSLLSRQTGFALYLSGAKLTGKLTEDLGYAVSLWSGNRNDRHDLFQEFGGGVLAAAKLTYNFGKYLDWADKANLSVHYRYNSDENNAAPKYEHLVSLASNWKSGRFSLGTDIIGGTGIGGGSDVFGVIILPTYEIWNGPIGKFELVGRYHFAKSSDDNGLALALRYERQAPDLTGIAGDEYNSFYVGMNWKLYDDKFKFMTGVNFAKMKDSANDGGEYDGHVFSAGVRMYF